MTFGFLAFCAVLMGMSLFTIASPLFYWFGAPTAFVFVYMCCHCESLPPPPSPARLERMSLSSAMGDLVVVNARDKSRRSERVCDRNSLVAFSVFPQFSCIRSTDLLATKIVLAPRT